VIESVPAKPCAKRCKGAGEGFRATYSEMGYDIEGFQGPIGHREVEAEEALGNASEYVVKITPVYSFYPQNTPFPLVKYSFWVI